MLCQKHRSTPTSRCWMIRQEVQNELVGIPAAVVQQTVRADTSRPNGPRCFRRGEQAAPESPGREVATTTVKAFNKAKLAVYAANGIIQVGIEPEARVVVPAPRKKRILGL